MKDKSNYLKECEVDKQAHVFGCPNFHGLSQIAKRLRNIIDILATLHADGQTDKETLK